MFYLTSFKIVADFLNNLNFFDVSQQVHLQLIFPEEKKMFLSHLAQPDNMVNYVQFFFLFH